MVLVAANTASQNTSSPVKAGQIVPAAQREVLQKKEEKPELISPYLQAKLTVGSPDDPFEREADVVADQVMRMPEQNFIQRKCSHCEEEKVSRKPLSQTITPLIQTSRKGNDLVSNTVENGINSSRGSGSALDGHTQSFMSSRFGSDFSSIKIHTDNESVQLNRSLNAKAFTVGNDVYFNEGQYNPGSFAGKQLLAHELTHVVQQKGKATYQVQRASNFCVPYASATEATDAEWWLRNTYLRLEGIETFGTEVFNLYDSYLNRHPGDSLSPRVFNDSGSYIHNSFKDDGYIKDDMDEVLDLVAARLHMMPGPPLRSGESSLMSLSNFLSASEMNNRPINFSNPFSVSGHIAGNIGSSDAGDDYRKITRANVNIEKVVLFGDTGYHLIELIPHYEVFDTIDFCPGDPGAPLEQLVTTTMSRLEASGEAYDMPFKVVFSPESRSKRYWF
jgi:hypothetical protein